ncbi:aspartate/glutamate racemase family protein [Marivita sp.]|uniref:aspartate/glutamate racemase family protein n=1 Tax=Marivita sp. TaxID=2003365 RepID=UPI003F6B7C27
MAVVSGGRNICGVSIGVLSLESYFPKPPGHIKNPSSLSFTTSYEIITGLTIPVLLNNPSPDMIAPLIAAAQRLEKSGVKAITGSCGFLALFQNEIAAAVNVPVFVSSLIQAELIHRMTGRPVGVLTASADLLSPRHLAAVGAENTPLVIEGMQEGTEFADVILRNSRNDMDLEKIEAELLAAGERLVARAPEVGAILLECTDLPPYAHALQSRLDRPVFDIITLATMIDHAVLRQPFSGFIN